MNEKTNAQPRTLRYANDGERGAIDSGGSLSRAGLYLAWVSIVLIVTLSTSATAAPAPILISEATSTRGIAVESLTLTREPFVLTSPYGGLGQRTRIMVFAMDLTLQTGEDSSVILADAEDAAHRHYPLIVESIRPVPSYESLSAVVFRLNDDLGDVGDVLLSVSYRGVISNRVRIAIGHIGGGPPNDAGAVPTPALPYKISGQLTGNGPSLGGFSITLSGPQSGTAVTDASGFYSFRVAQIGEYTLTPAPNPYYTFVPPTFTNVGFNHIVNLPGTLRFYTIAGAVQLGPNSAAFMEVPISGSQTTSVTTDALGRFEISLAAGGNYTFTFAQTYYTFNPATWPITDLKADRSWCV